MTLPIEFSREGQPVEAAFAAAFQFELPIIASSMDQLLGSAERSVLASFRFPQRRDSYLLGRYSGKEALRACLKHAEVSELEIIKGVFEQPVVVSARHGSAELSLAHSAGVAVALACRAGHPVGIDVEHLQRGDFDFLKTANTEREEKLVAELKIPTHLARYLFWTIKEALSKALRCGLMTSFQVLEIGSVSGDANCGWTSEFTSFAQYKARSWLLDEYVLSIVLPKKTEVLFSPEPLVPLLAKARQTASASSAWPG